MLVRLVNSLHFNIRVVGNPIERGCTSGGCCGGPETRWIAKTYSVTMRRGYPSQDHGSIYSVVLSRRVALDIADFTKRKASLDLRAAGAQCTSSTTNQDRRTATSSPMRMFLSDRHTEHCHQTMGTIVGTSRIANALNIPFETFSLGVRHYFSY